jgi:hypothetical protein
MHLKDNIALFDLLALQPFQPTHEIISLICVSHAR